jgi:hypothetical protein
MKFLKASPRSISVTALTLSFLALLSTNIYFASSSSDSISGCVNKKTGVLRIAVKCTSAENKLNWSKVGPQGLVGPMGPQGLVGPMGPQGLVGPMGPQGVVGPTGLQGLIGPTGLQGLVGPSGATGATGAAGSNGSPGSNGAPGPAGYFQVYDAQGTLVGPLVMGDAYGKWVVLWDGIPIPYSPTFGYVADNQEGFYFMNSNCSGNVYWRSNSDLISQSDTSTLSYDWQAIGRFSNVDPLLVSRIVSGVRVGTNLMVPASQSARVETTTAYRLAPNNDSGTTYSCNTTTSADYNRYFQLALSSHPSPPDRVGPLTIRVG